MQLEITNSKSSKIKFKVTAKLKAGDLAKQKEALIQKLGKNIKVAGFRAGKAPLNLLEAKIDPNLLARELAGSAVDKAFAAMVEEFKLDLLGQPKIDITEFDLEKGMTVTFVGNTKPEITLPDYAKWPKPKTAKTSISNSEIDQVLQDLTRNMSGEKEVNRAAKNGDKAVIDFDGTDLKGKPIDGAAGKKFPLVLGSNSFIPGFEDEVIGVKPGEEKEFKIKFPKDYHAASLQSKEVKFKIKLNQVLELTPPKIDDELAKQFGNFNTLDALKADIELELLERKRREALEAQKEEVVDRLAKEIKFEMPEILLEENIENALQNARSQAANQGKEFTDWLKEHGFKDEEELKLKEATPKATRNIKVSLGLRAIADKEGIGVSREEILSYTNALLEQYQHPDARKQILQPAEQARIEGMLLADKVLSMLTSDGAVTPKVQAKKTAAKKDSSAKKS